MAEAAAPERQMKRALTAFDLTCVGIGAIIGAGLLWPFKKSAVGAVIGLVAQLAVLYLLIAPGMLI